MNNNCNFFNDKYVWLLKCLKIKTQVFQPLVTSLIRNTVACRLSTQGPAKKATAELWSNNAVTWISTRRSVIWVLYISLLTVAVDRSWKDLVSFLNWPPPLLFLPSCHEPDHVLLPSLPFYLAWSSFSHFYLASDCIRFSSWYLFLYILFFLVQLLKIWITLLSISVNIHRYFFFHAYLIWFALHTCVRIFAKPVLFFSPYVVQHVSVLTHQCLFWVCLFLWRESHSCLSLYTCSSLVIAVAWGVIFRLSIGSRKGGF